MCNTLEICNGAFKAELVKGKNGVGEWKYTPTYAKPKKVKAKVVEKPQYSFIEKAEKETVKSYQKVLKTTVLDIVNFLKEIK